MQSSNLIQRRQWTWTDKQIDKLNKVKAILIDLERFKPLTLRQIYYQLVGKAHIENKVSEYTMLSKLIKQARIDGYLSWNDIEDRVRVIEYGAGWSNQEEFINDELDDFLERYKRHLVQDQDVFIEVWIEKDALRTIFSRITLKYCISTVVCRGFSSISFLNSFRERVLKAQEENKRPIMLYFGDFDPSGNEMLPSMQTTLEMEMDLHGVEFKRIALTKDDIYKYKLPHDPAALKKSDTRAKKHIDKYGFLAVEIDALHPEVLEQKIRDAIECELNFDRLKVQESIYLQELKEIQKLKHEAVNFMKS